MNHERGHCTKDFIGFKNNDFGTRACQWNYTSEPRVKTTSISLDITYCTLSMGILREANHVHTWLRHNCSATGSPTVWRSLRGSYQMNTSQARVLRRSTADDRTSIPPGNDSTNTFAPWRMTQHDPPAQKCASPCISQTVGAIILGNHQLLHCQVMGFFSE